jgi:MFS family permease
MRVYRLIGYTSALTLLLIGMGDVSAFVNIPALILVAGFAHWGFLASAGSQTGTALTVALSPDERAESDLQTGLQALLTARYAALAGGLVSFIAGLVTMLRHADDPSALGAGMATALLGVLYAVFLAYFLLLPLQAGIETHAMPAHGAEAVQPENGLDMAVLVIGSMLTVASFVILLNSLNNT